MRLVTCLATMLLLLAAACGDDDGPGPTAGTSATPATATGTPEPTQNPTGQPTAGPTGEPTASPTERPAQTEPLGFPIDPEMRIGWVVGNVGSRTLEWGAGPSASVYSREGQTSDDPEAANIGGWNCRVHVEYEGQPAVDWYIPEGTAIYSTMDGTATLYAITVANAFDYWGVDREPYLGNPDRSRAPVVPFPGASGGKGVFVRVENGEFVTEYAHLDLGATSLIVPEASFVAGYGPQSEWASLFGEMRGYLDWTELATWEVKVGDLIGISGDSGYSEAPHLHYTIERQGAGARLCPTAEAGFADGGWLDR